MPSRLSSKVLTLSAVTLAAAAATAGLVFPRTGHACSCAEDSWTLRLVSVTTHDSASDHEAHWPKEASYFPIDDDLLVLTDESIADEGTLHHLEFRRRGADGGIR